MYDLAPNNRTLPLSVGEKTKVLTTFDSPCVTSLYNKILSLYSLQVVRLSTIVALAKDVSVHVDFQLPL